LDFTFTNKPLSVGQEKRTHYENKMQVNCMRLKNAEWNVDNSSQTKSSSGLDENN